MSFSNFVSRIEQSDEEIFKAIIGLTRAEFDILFAAFNSDKDSTITLSTRQKLYAILIIKKWNITIWRKIASIILNSTCNHDRNGKTFLTQVGNRLERTCQQPNLSLYLREK